MPLTAFPQAVNWSSVSQQWQERLINSYRKQLLQVFVAKGGLKCYWVYRGNLFDSYLISECWFTFLRKKGLNNSPLCILQSPELAKKSFCGTYCGTLAHKSDSIHIKIESRYLLCFPHYLGNNWKSVQLWLQRDHFILLANIQDQTTEHFLGL